MTIPTHLIPSKKALSALFKRLLLRVLLSVSMVPCPSWAGDEVEVRLMPQLGAHFTSLDQSNSQSIFQGYGLGGDLELRFKGLRYEFALAVDYDYIHQWNTANSGAGRELLDSNQTSIMARLYMYEVFIGIGVVGQSTKLTNTGGTGASMLGYAGKVQAGYDAPFIKLFQLSADAYYQRGALFPIHSSLGRMSYETFGVVVRAGIHF